MKKGVILSSKLPYLLGGVRNCHATNKSTKFHAPRREPFASSSRSGQVFRTFQVRTRAFSSIYVYVVYSVFISLFWFYFRLQKYNFFGNCQQKVRFLFSQPIYSVVFIVRYHAHRQLDFTAENLLHHKHILAPMLL